jgi:hypothetical protein
VPAETDVEQGPLDRNEVFEIVRANLADILEIEPSTISEGQSFVDDLDADSSSWSKRWRRTSASVPSAFASRMRISSI